MPMYLAVESYQEANKQSHHHRRPNKETHAETIQLMHGAKIIKCQKCEMSVLLLAVRLPLCLEFCCAGQYHWIASRCSPNGGPGSAAGVFCLRFDFIRSKQHNSWMKIAQSEWQKSHFALHIYYVPLLGCYNGYYVWLSWWAGWN